MYILCCARAFTEECIYSKKTTFSPCSSWSATLSLDVARSAGPDNMAVAKVRNIPKAAVYKPDPAYNHKQNNILLGNAKKTHDFGSASYFLCATIYQRIIRATIKYCACDQPHCRIPMFIYETNVKIQLFLIKVGIPKYLMF